MKKLYFSLFTCVLILTGCAREAPMSEGEVNSQLSLACSEISAGEELVDQGFSSESDLVQNHFEKAYRIGKNLSLQMSEYKGFEYLGDLANGTESDWSWCGMRIDPSYQ